MNKASRPCGHCGEPTVRKGKTGVAPAYCDKPDCYKRCALPECDSATRATWCPKHEYRNARYGDPRTAQREHVSNIGRQCGVDACERAAVTKGYCDSHYKKFHRHGDPLGGLSDNSGTCSVASCSRSADSKTWCRKHYNRWRTYGDPVAGAHLKQFMADDPDRPSCSVVDCDRPYKSNGLCRAHHYRFERYGDPLGPAPVKDADCLFCGATVHPGRYKAYCSDSCYWAVRNNGLDAPLGAACSVCGDWIDFLVTANGKRRYQRRRWCWDCYMRARSAPHAMTTAQLAERDGTACGICRKPVDMTITGRDTHMDGQMMPSVDHVTPLSWGGLNVPENVQLAHLLCNIRKNDHYESLAR